MEIPEAVRNMLVSSSARLSDEERARLHAENHNATEGKLNEADNYDCKRCRNKGTVANAVQRPDGTWETEIVDCRCLITRANIRRLEQSGLKSKVKDCTFDRFTVSEPWQEKIKSAAAEYARSANGWLYIGGQSGAGKTHLCTAICREFMLAGKSVKYMLWRDEVVRLKAAVKDEDSYRGIIERYKTVRVLYIDDLFKSGKAEGEAARPTAADINIAFEILNYRYNDPALLTVISSELTFPDIIDIDEALAGRINERAGFGDRVFNIEADGAKNYRLKGGSK